MSKFDEQLRVIEGLRENVDGLMIKLKRSLDIVELCPDAFQHGSAQANFETVEGETCYRIRKGNGETITFAFDEVPDSIIETEIERRDITLNPSRRRGMSLVDVDLQKFLRKKKAGEALERRRQVAGG